jgi:hypothetical protein
VLGIYGLGKLMIRLDLEFGVGGVQASIRGNVDLILVNCVINDFNCLARVSRFE